MLSNVVRFSYSISAPNARYSDHMGIAFDEAIAQGPIEIVTGTTDSQLALGGTGTVNFFFLLSDQEITINLEASTGTDITVLANRPFIASRITGVWVSNSSGSTANIVYYAAGT